MPTIKLTRRAISTITPPVGSGPAFYYDSDLTGFGLRVMPSGAASWIVEYRVGAGGRTAQKKRVTLGPTSKLSPEEARSAAQDMLARVTLGADPGRAKADLRASRTVADLVQDYLTEHVAKVCKAKTLENYQQSLNVHLRPSPLSKTRAAEATRSDVARFHTVAGRRGTYAANRALALVSAAFTWGGKHGYVPESHNPATGVKRFSESSRERFLTDEELARLGAAMREAETIGLPYSVDEANPKAKHAPKEASRRTKQQPHAIAAIRLLLLTGCRISEVLQARWSDIDTQRGILNLADSKTGKKPVVLSPAAVDILKGLERVGRYVIAGDNAGDPDEKPRSDLKRPWAAVCKRANLEGVRIHDLRHTFASLGAAEGLSLPVIGKLLGHTNPRTTQRYAHLTADQSRDAARGIGDRLTGLI